DAAHQRLRTMDSRFGDLNERIASGRTNRVDAPRPRVGEARLKRNVERGRGRIMRPQQDFSIGQTHLVDDVFRRSVVVERDLMSVSLLARVAHLVTKSVEGERE